MPTCDMEHHCTNAITHIGEKGYVYCAEHVHRRHGIERCRKLRAFEIHLLDRGVALPSYRPLSKSETLAKMKVNG